MKLSDQHHQAITKAVTDRYGNIAAGSLPKFRYPTGDEGLVGQAYPSELTSTLPPEIRKLFCGVGNPFSLGRPVKGEHILDIGCGAGIDTLLAAIMVAPDGEAAGIDPVPGVSNRAEANRKSAGITNASFHTGAAAALPFQDEAFDRIISNGAINLIVDKAAALKEMFRVLKPGGHLQIADQVLTGPPPLTPADAVTSWAA